MLTVAQKTIIKSTIPLLETGGEALINYFYQLMLDERPDVRVLFNPTHQLSGAQPRALANAVLKYAQHIDELEKLGPLANQIMHKHTALQVQREHYPIVGQYLLRSIREVLGAEIATDDVLDAWAAAYQQLADILINGEARLYDKMASAPGGWYGGRAFRLEQKVAENTLITSFYLAPTDEQAIVDFIPGQYIGLCCQIDGQEVRRNYSLSAAPNSRTYRITVKREENGIASNYLHDRVNEGDELMLFPPAGNFQLINNHKPLVLISAGVGITPTMSMLEATLGSDREVIFINYAQTAKVQTFRAQIEAFKARYPLLTTHWVLEEYHADYAEAEGRSTQQQLAAWLPHDRDAEVYFLGPTPFMAFINKTLQQLGVPQTQIHYEFFGPIEELSV